MNAQSLSAVAAENVRAEMGRQRISVLALSKQTGINRTSLGRKVSGDVAMSLDEVELIARYLNVSMWDLVPLRATA